MSLLPLEPAPHAASTLGCSATRNASLCSLHPELLMDIFASIGRRLIGSGVCRTMCRVLRDQPYKANASSLLYLRFLRVPVDERDSVDLERLIQKLEHCNVTFIVPSDIRKCRLVGGLIEKYRLLYAQEISFEDVDKSSASLDAMRNLVNGMIESVFLPHRMVIKQLVTLIRLRPIDEASTLIPHVMDRLLSVHENSPSALTAQFGAISLWDYSNFNAHAYASVSQKMRTWVASMVRTQQHGSPQLDRFVDILCVSTRNALERGRKLPTGEIQQLEDTLGLICNIAFSPVVCTLKCIMALQQAAFHGFVDSGRAGLQLGVVSKAIHVVIDLTRYSTAADVSSAASKALRLMIYAARKQRAIYDLFPESIIDTLYVNSFCKLTNHFHPISLPACTLERMESMVALVTSPQFTESPHSGVWMKSSSRILDMMLAAAMRSDAADRTRIIAVGYLVKMCVKHEDIQRIVDNDAVGQIVAYLSSSVVFSVQDKHSVTSSLCQLLRHIHDRGAPTARNTVIRHTRESIFECIHEPHFRSGGAGRAATILLCHLNPSGPAGDLVVSALHKDEHIRALVSIPDFMRNDDSLVLARLPEVISELCGADGRVMNMMCKYGLPEVLLRVIDRMHHECYHNQSVASVVESTLRLFVSLPVAAIRDIPPTKIRIGYAIGQHVTSTVYPELPIRVREYVLRVCNYNVELARVWAATGLVDAVMARISPTTMTVQQLSPLASMLLCIAQCGLQARIHFIQHVKEIADLAKSTQLDRYICDKFANLLRTLVLLDEDETPHVAGMQQIPPDVQRLQQMVAVSGLEPVLRIINQLDTHSTTKMLFAIEALRYNHGRQLIAAGVLSTLSQVVNNCTDEMNRSIASFLRKEILAFH